jgi:DNA-binding winged helix-turn-helix (wHTH) protein
MSGVGGRRICKRGAAGRRSCRRRICKLRKKLASASYGKDYIETVWGRGYVLREPHEGKTKLAA